MRLLPGARGVLAKIVVGLVLGFVELVFVELDSVEAMMADGCFGAQRLMDLSGGGPASTVYQPT